MKKKTAVKNCAICNEEVLKYIDGEGEVKAVCRLRHVNYFGRHTEKEIYEGKTGAKFVTDSGGYTHICKGCNRELAKSDGKVKFYIECPKCGESNVFEKGIKQGIKEGTGHFGRLEEKIHETVNPEGIK